MEKSRLGPRISDSINSKPNGMNYYDEFGFFHRIFKIYISGISFKKICEMNV